MAKKTHNFTHSHHEHHEDGSITVHHVHKDGPHKDVKHAAADLDAAHDSMEDHLGTPNPGEAEAEAGPQAAGASAPPAPLPAMGA